MRLTILAAKAELFKIFLRKKYSVLLILQSALCVLLLLLSCGNGIPIFGRYLDLPAAPYVILNVGMMVVLPLIIFMLVSDLFAGEMENGSMKAVLLRPVSRLKIFLAKISAIAVFVLINLLLICAISVIFRLIFGGVGDVPSLLIAFSLSIIPMLPVIATSALIAQKIGNGSLAMFSSLIVYIVLQAAGLLHTKLGAALFTTHFEWYKMFLGNTVPWLSAGNILLLILSYTALFLLGGWLLFERNEI